jgi:tetratricopeptide (TPR) repeat protein
MQKLEKAAFYIVLAVSFLLPIAFVSPAVLAVDTLKMSIFSIGTSISLFLILISEIKSGKFLNIKGKMRYAILAIPLSFILSAIAVVKVSGFQTPFLGNGSETTTVLFALTALAFVYTVVVVLKTKERFLTLLSSIVLGGSIITLFHLVRFVFGADTLSFGIFVAQITNTVGQWSDLGIYFGFLFLLSYFAVEFMSLSKVVKIFLYGLGGISLVFLILNAVNPVWYAVLVPLLFAALYQKKHSKLSYRTIILLLIAIVFAIFGTKISNKFSDSFGINYLDVRPSWELSIDLANQTIQQNPLFGSGPNKYTNVYLQNKPQSINQTVFWSLDFTSGVSYITSFVVMLGVFGSLAMLWLLIVIGIYMYKAYRHGVTDPLQRFSIVSSVGLTVYTIIAGLLYTPSLPIIVLGLTSFALFLVALKQEGILAASIQEATPRTAMIAKIVMLIVSILLLIGTIFFLRRTIGDFYFQKAIVVLNTKSDIATAEIYVKKAIAMVHREVYYRGLAELSVIKINQLLTSLKDVDQKSIDTLKSYLEEGITSAQKTIQIDPLDYQNYITQGRVYESVVPARVNLAYENAIKSYASAASLNPLNPSIYLLAAQLEVAMKKLPEAKQFIGRALEVKNNYSDAIFLLSQIQVSENSIKDAIISLLVLAQLNPKEPTTFFQLGLLYYNTNDNVNAGIALSKAVELSPAFSNARYFLGLTYARLGKYPEAVIQFEEIAKFNPENSEVANIIATLKAGRSPFQTVKSPEKAKTPPVKDAIDKKTSTKVKTR